VSERSCSRPPMKDLKKSKCSIRSTVLNAFQPASGVKTTLMRVARCELRVARCEMRDASYLRQGRSQTAGRSREASPYVCETTKPLAWDV
jgi:hypothetical protein